MVLLSLRPGVRPALGTTQPPIQCVPGALFPGIKRPGRESDHSHNLVSRLRKRGAIAPFPHYVFMAWCLIQYEILFTA
jgi:hypothetical protein